MLASLGGESEGLLVGTQEVFHMLRRQQCPYYRKKGQTNPHLALHAGFGHNHVAQDARTTAADQSSLVEEKFQGIPLVHTQGAHHELHALCNFGWPNWSWLDKSSNSVVLTH